MEGSSEDDFREPSMPGEPWLLCSGIQYAGCLQGRLSTGIAPCIDDDLYIVLSCISLCLEDELDT